MATKKPKKTRAERLADRVGSLGPKDETEAHQIALNLLAEDQGETSADDVLSGRTQGRTAADLDALAWEAAVFCFRNRF